MCFFLYLHGQIWPFKLLMCLFFSPKALCAYFLSCAYKNECTPTPDILIPPAHPPLTYTEVDSWVISDLKSLPGGNSGNAKLTKGLLIAAFRVRQDSSHINDLYE